MFQPGPTAPIAAAVSLPADAEAGLAVFFLVGLLGGAHCLGMCGPLVTLYADRMPDSKGVTWYDLRQHAAFNLGRTLGYAAVGAMLGAVGALVFDAAAVLRVADAVRAVSGVAVGAVVVLAGLGYLVRGRASGSHASPVLGRLFGRVHGLLVGRVDAWARGSRIVALGTVHAVLPCPLLYPAYLYALARGSPLVGAASLAALGLGTFPALFAFGTAFGSVPTGWRTRLNRALGAAFVALGTIPLLHGLALLGITVPHVEIPIYQPL
ncbi:hypothetical protein BRC81_15475 [Halobacteriales archaeon QS_1_68_20]|nr:MAG: hypothetical protein BRC81_15475 [Halobacteriales archaeon QS_1_68_20]